MKSSTNLTLRKVAKSITCFFGVINIFPNLRHRNKHTLKTTAFVTNEDEFLHTFTIW